MARTFILVAFSAMVLPSLVKTKASLGVGHHGELFEGSHVDHPFWHHWHSFRTEKPVEELQKLRLEGESSVLGNDEVNCLVALHAPKIIHEADLILKTDGTFTGLPKNVTEAQPLAFKSYRENDQEVFLIRVLLKNAHLVFHVKISALRDVEADKKKSNLVKVLGPRMENENISKDEFL